MATAISEELLNDPVALAIAVLMERIRGLSKDDRNDLFELAEALAGAQTDEETEAAARGMREILKQQASGIRAMEPTEPCPELGQWMNFVGGRIRHFREAAGLTQEQLAAKAGLPQSHISRLETGRHSPSSLTLEKIAAAIGIDPSELDPST